MKFEFSKDELKEVHKTINSKSPAIVEFSKDELERVHKTIGRNVKRHREKKGISQLELSLEMGNKSVSLVSAAELNTGRKHFNIEHLYKISKILNVNMSVFFENLQK
jgi:putative transcriptional regulator